MRFAVKILAAGAVLSMLAACGTIDAEKVADMENKGDAFAGHLRDGYVEIGGWEAAKDDYDWSDSDRHYNKAISAANGELVLPEEISSRKLPDTHVAELTAARQRLLNSLDGPISLLVVRVSARLRWQSRANSAFRSLPPGAVFLGVPWPWRERTTPSFR